MYDDIDYKLTWAAMEKLVGEGLVRSIGLSNFNSRQIDDILSVASIKPTVLQVQGVCDDEKVYLNWSKHVKCEHCCSMSQVWRSESYR